MTRVTDAHLRQAHRWLVRYAFACGPVSHVVEAFAEILATRDAHRTRASELEALARVVIDGTHYCDTPSPYSCHVCEAIGRLRASLAGGAASEGEAPPNRSTEIGRAIADVAGIVVVTDEPSVNFAWCRACGGEWAKGHPAQHRDGCTFLKVVLAAAIAPRTETSERVTRKTARAEVRRIVSDWLRSTRMHVEGSVRAAAETLIAAFPWASETGSTEQ